MNKPIEIPIYQKQNLTIEEAAVKRKLFDEFIEKVYSI